MLELTRARGAAVAGAVGPHGHPTVVRRLAARQAPAQARRPHPLTGLINSKKKFKKIDF